MLSRAYYLSSHAEEEMAADRFDRPDVEFAILHGRIARRYTEDARGVRYRILGPSPEGRFMNVVCRFREAVDLVIITVYAAE